MSELLTRHESRLVLRRKLERQLSLLQPGQPLPPIRTLKKTLGVSNSRLIGLLDELDDEGLIERHSRKGVFKSTSQGTGQTVPVLDLIACGRTGDVKTEGTFCTELLESLTLTCSQRNQGIRLHQFWLNESVSSYAALANQSGVRACIFLGLHTPELPGLFEERGIAWVSLLPQTHFHTPRTIMDSSNVVPLQLEHLWSLGHEKIAYLDRVNPEGIPWVISARREDYYRMMAQRGYIVYPHWVANGGFDDSVTLAALEQIYSRSPYPTALLVRDPQLPMTYRFLENRGYRVGRDVSVVGTDDLRIARTVHPAATTVRNPRDVMTSMALEMLERVLQGKDVDEVQEVPVEMVVRESTAPAPKSEA